MRPIFIILFLIGIFTLSVFMRIQPAEYGLELNEFDPYFNYRATGFFVDNGLDKYLNWHDHESWYPDGRNIAATSQVGLHLTTGYTYQAFESVIDLRTFVIIFPVIVGSISTVFFFFFVKNLLGLRVAMIASIFYSIAYPIIMRGTIGWFKSEPLGLFYGFAALMVLSYALKTTNIKKSVGFIILSSTIMFLGISSWGGVFFFLGIALLYLMVTPLFNKNRINFIRMPVFYLPLLILLPLITRTNNFLESYYPYIITPLVLFTLIVGIKHINGKKRFLMAIPFIIMITLIASNMNVADSRYNYIINPLIDERSSLYIYIAEHQPLNLPLVLEHNAFLLIFMWIGILALIKARGDRLKKTYVIIISVFGFYIGTSIIRLEMFMTIAMIILSAYGISYLFDKMNERNLTPVQKRKTLFIVLLLIASMVIPSAHAWMVMSGFPPSILNGGSFFITSTTDWKDSMEWLKHNTPKDARVFAWWDYGYWITTLGERTTYADNAASSSVKIIEMAGIITGDVDNGYKKLKEMDADYILFNIMGERTEDGIRIYGGGDESKIDALASMSNNTGLLNSNLELTDKFWNDTLIGRLIPFEKTENNHYEYMVKPDKRFELAYQSPSVTSDDRIMIGVFIFRIN